MVHISFSGGNLVINNVCIMDFCRFVRPGSCCDGGVMLVWTSGSDLQYLMLNWWLACVYHQLFGTKLFHILYCNQISGAISLSLRFNELKGTDASPRFGLSLNRCRIYVAAINITTVYLDSKCSKCMLTFCLLIGRVLREHLTRKCSDRTTLPLR